MNPPAKHTQVHSSQTHGVKLSENSTQFFSELISLNNQIISLPNRKILIPIAIMQLQIPALILLHGVNCKMFKNFPTQPLQCCRQLSWESYFLLHCLRQSGAQNSRSESAISRQNHLSSSIFIASLLDSGFKLPKWTCAHPNLWENSRTSPQSEKFHGTDRTPDVKTQIAFQVFASLQHPPLQTSRYNLDHGETL